MRENELTIIENFLENKEEKLDVKEEPFDKLMFFYESALKQLNLQIQDQVVILIMIRKKFVLQRKMKK